MLHQYKGKIKKKSFVCICISVMYLSDTSRAWQLFCLGVGLSATLYSKQFIDKVIEEPPQKDCLLYCGMLAMGCIPPGTGTGWVSKKLYLWWHWAGQKGCRNEKSSSCIRSGRKELLNQLKLGTWIALLCVVCPVSVLTFAHTCCHRRISSCFHLFYLLPVDKNPTTIPQSLLPAQGGGGRND